MSTPCSGTWAPGTGSSSTPQATETRTTTTTASAAGEKPNHVLSLKRVKQSIHFYRSQRKFRERNFFTGVCLFTRVSHVTISHDILDLAVTPSPDMGPGYLPLPLGSDIWWSSLKTCSNLPQPVLTPSGGHRNT